ncbi:hypothetical protein JCM16303_003571 [Sporobolomyces ruberrimus]
MAIETQTRTVEAVTRLCYYRNADPETWVEFVRQAAEDASQAEKDAAESILSLISESDVTQHTLFGFLQHSLHGPSQLIRPAYLARFLIRQTPTLFSARHTESIFSLLNASRFHAHDTSPPYLADTPDEIAQGLIDLIENVLHGLVPSSPPSTPSNETYAPETIKWSISFLSSPQARSLSAKTLQNSPLLPACVGSLERILDSLTQHADSRHGQALIDPLTSVLARLNTNGNKRRPMPRLSTRIKGPELDLFVATLFASTPRTIGSNLSTRLRAILEYRQVQAVFLSITKEEATIAAFVDLFEAALAGDRSSTAPITRSILGVKLSKLIARAVKQDGLLRASIAEAIKRINSKKPGDGMDIDGGSSFEDLITGLCRERLISQDVALSINPSLPLSQLHSTPPSTDLHSRLSSHDSDEIKQALSGLSTDLPLQSEASSAICEVVASHAQSSDLHALAQFCDILIQDATILEIVLIHEEPRRLLAPIRETLDSLDTAQDNFGESNLIEQYGNLTVFVQIVVHRFHLIDNLSHHLGSSQSFLSSWIPTSSAAYTLGSLDDEGRTAVAGFISALFGDGISDDLMHATNPRTLLKIAPTILKQSLVACQNGAVDLDSLKDALSYFLQELLSFTLPGVLQWLIGEIERTPPSLAQSAMFDILQVIIFAEALPRAVLELVSLDLARLIAGISHQTSTSSPSFDSVRAKRLVIGLLPRFRRAPANTPTPTASWSDQLRHHLTALSQGAKADASSDATLVQQAVSHLVRYSPEKAAFQIVSILLPLAPDLWNPPPRTLTPTDEIACVLRTQVERTGAAVFCESFPLLSSLVNRVLPAFLSNPLFSLSAKDPVERARVEMLSDIVGGAFVANLAAPEDEGTDQVVTLLNRLAEDLGPILKKTQEVGGDGEEDMDRPPLPRVFVDRLASFEPLTVASEALARLSSPQS